MSKEHNVTENYIIELSKSWHFLKIVLKYNQKLRWRTTKTENILEKESFLEKKTFSFQKTLIKKKANITQILLRSRVINYSVGWMLKIMIKITLSSWMKMFV